MVTHGEVALIQIKGTRLPWLIFFADVWDARKICEHSKTFLFYGAAHAQQWQRPSVHGISVARAGSLHRPPLRSFRQAACSNDGSRRQKQEGPKSLGRLPVRVHDRPIEAARLFCPCLASQASSDLRPPMLPSRRSQSLKRAKPKLAAPSFPGHLRIFHTSFVQTQVWLFDHSSWSPK